MSHELIVNYNQKPCYKILIEENYSHLYLELEKLETKNRKICIVSDSNVGQYYTNQVIEIVKDYSHLVETFTFPAGEENKNLNVVQNLYEHLILSKFDRNDLLIALGGGVVGDLTGYVAATYLRGINFIQMPTSLLSMVDSSIGGKTGVDFNAYKNMVGAFHQPKSVYMNISSLSTLSDVQYYSGFGEIIKHGLIKDKEYFYWLKENILSLKNREKNTVMEMIYRSCQIKKQVVEEDPTEKGERALLNFGHTLGHAIEKLMNFTLLHGECVAIGMVAASYISYERGNITKEELDEIISLIKEYELPVTITNLDYKDIIEASKHDKKMEAGKIKFILLEQIGKAVIDESVTEDEMRRALVFITM